MVRPPSSYPIPGVKRLWTCDATGRNNELVAPAQKGLGGVSSGSGAPLLAPALQPMVFLQPAQVLCSLRHLSSCRAGRRVGHQARVWGNTPALPLEDVRKCCPSVHTIPDALRLISPPHSQAPHGQVVLESCPCYILKFSESISVLYPHGHNPGSSLILSFLHWPPTQSPCLQSPPSSAQLDPARV